MKLGILARNPQLYSHRRLAEVAKQRGHQVRFINPLKCSMDVGKDCAKICYNETEVLNFDAVIPRIGASVTFYGTALVHHFEAMGTFVLNSSLSISQSRDKFRTFQCLTHHGIDMPKTSFSYHLSDPKQMIERIGGAPVIIKILEGTQGNGVFLAQNYAEAVAIIKKLNAAKQNFLIQEFIQESAGEDIRLLVVGDEIVAVMKRKAREGEYRSNLHQGGSAFPTELLPGEKEAALNAMKILGLNVAGVDLLRSNDGPKILEVNSCPGLEGIEGLTSIDIAEKIIGFIEGKLAVV